MEKIIALTIIVLGVFVGCKEKKNSFAMPESEINVAKPEVRDISLTKEYPGYLSADETVDIVARVSGTLESVNFKSGELVTKDQLLYVIEPTLYKNALTQAEANLKTAQAKLEYAQSNYDRMKEAIKSDAVSRIQFIEAESNVTEALAAVSNSEAALNTAKTNLGYCYIKAPFTGHIDRSKLDVGSYVDGAATPVTLTTIYKDDKIKAYFSISDNQWLTLKMNSPEQKNKKNQIEEVDIRLGQEGGQVYKGILDYLSPSVDLSTGTITLRAELDNKDNSLKNGEYVNITLPYGEQKNAILIPDASIGTGQAGKYIYVVSDSNVVKYRNITVGQLVDGDLRQVTDGLSPNELYVTKALLKVKDGMIIKPIMENEKKN